MVKEIGTIGAAVMLLFKAGGMRSPIMNETSVRLLERRVQRCFQE